MFLETALKGIVQLFWKFANILLSYPEDGHELINMLTLSQEKQLNKNVIVIVSWMEPS